MHWYRANRYFFKKTPETVCTGCRVADGIRERVPDCGAGNCKGPTAVKCWAGSEVLQVVDGWRNAAAADCQHRVATTSNYSRSCWLNGNDMQF